MTIFRSRGLSPRATLSASGTDATQAGYPIREKCAANGRRATAVKSRPHRLVTYVPRVGWLRLPQIRVCSHLTNRGVKPLTAGRIILVLAASLQSVVDSQLGRADSFLRTTSPKAGSKNRVDPLASNDIKQHKRWTARPLCTSLQLGDITRG